MPIAAATEEDLRGLFVKALRRAKFGTLCAKESPFAVPAWLGLLFVWWAVTFGLFLAEEALDVSLWWTPLLALACYFGFGLLMSVAQLTGRALRLEPYTALRLAVLPTIVIGVPATWAFVVIRSGLDDSLVTHGIPLFVLFVVVGARRIRDLFVLGQAPVALSVVLTGLIILLFTEEVWEAADSFDWQQRAELAGLLLCIPFVVLLLLLLSSVPLQFSRVARRFQSDPNDAMSTAEEQLRRADKNAADALLGSRQRPGVVDYFRERERPPPTITDPDIRELLRDAFTSAGAEAEARSKIYPEIRYRVWGRIAVRLVSLVVIVGLLAFVYSYVVARFAADAGVAPPGADPTELDVAVLLSIFAALAFLVEGIADRSYRQELVSKLIRDPTEQVLAVALPYRLLPTNDLFERARELDGLAGEVVGSNVGAGEESRKGEPAHHGTPGGSSVWYRWTAPSDGNVVVATQGSSFDTILALYEGERLGSLTGITSDDDSGIDGTSRVTFWADAGHIYHIAVDGFRGVQGTIALSWFLTPSDPPLNDDFGDAFDLVGEHGSVSGWNLAASSEPEEPSHDGFSPSRSVWYRWTAPVDGDVLFAARLDFDGVLAVYTGDGLERLTVIDSDSGTGAERRVGFWAHEGNAYSIAVDGVNGAQGSITLSWAVAARNDAFAEAVELVGERGSIAGSSLGATKEAGEHDHHGSTGGASLWYRWRAERDGEVVFTTAGSDFDTVLAAYTGDELPGLLGIASNDDVSVVDRTSRISFVAEAGTVYHVAVDGHLGAQGIVRLEWTTTPANDNFAAATRLDGRHGSISGWNLAASKEPGEPPHSGNPGGRSVWFTWSAPTNGEVVWTTAGSDFDTLLAVYTGDHLHQMRLIASDDDSGPGSTSSVTVEAIAGTLYRIAVDGYGGAQGNIALAWFSPSVAPANDAFADATELGGELGSVSGANLAASKEPGEPEHHFQIGGSSVWYRWQAPREGEVIFATEGSSFDTVLAVYIGDDLESLLPIASDDDSGPDRTSRVGFAAEGGRLYQIAVDGYSGATGIVTLSWHMP